MGTFSNPGLTHPGILILELPPGGKYRMGGYGGVGSIGLICTRPFTHVGFGYQLHIYNLTLHELLYLHTFSNYLIFDAH